GPSSGADPPDGRGPRDGHHPRDLHENDLPVLEPDPVQRLQHTAPHLGKKTTRFGTCCRRRVLGRVNALDRGNVRLVSEPCQVMKRIGHVDGISARDLQEVSFTAAQQIEFAFGSPIRPEPWENRAPPCGSHPEVEHVVPRLAQQNQPYGPILVELTLLEPEPPAIADIARSEDPDHPVRRPCPSGSAARAERGGDASRDEASQITVLPLVPLIDPTTRGHPLHLTPP